MAAPPWMAATPIAAFEAKRRRTDRARTAKRSAAAEAERRRAGRPTVLFRDAKGGKPGFPRALSRGVAHAGGKQLPTALAGPVRLTPTRPPEGHGCGTL